MNLRGLTLALAAVFLFGATGLPVLGDVDVNVSLQDAVKQGLVDVKVSSLGGATGNTVKVSVKNRTATSVKVDLSPGTVFLSREGRVQNITGGVVKGEFTQGLRYRPGSTMVLVDTNWHHYLIEGFCLDYHKGPPRRGQEFGLAMHDQRTARILNAPPDVKPTTWAYQLAIWMDRAGVSAAEVRHRYPNRLTDVDVRVAQSLLHHAEQSGRQQLPKQMDPEVRQQAEKIYSTDPQVRGTAVKVLVRMGDRARAAMPYVAVNAVTDRPGQWSLDSLPPVPATSVEVATLLEGLNLPDLQPWTEGVMREGPSPIPRIPGVTEPGSIPGVRGFFDLSPLIAPYLSGLSDGTAQTRRKAARSLADHKSPEVVEALIGALDDPDETVRKSVAESLAKVTGQDFGTDAAKWKQWWAANKDGFSADENPPRGREF